MTFPGLAAAAREAPEEIALVTPEGALLTYAELAAKVARVASLLIASRVGPGARVAFWSTTREAALFAMLAALELGATLVPIHPRLSSAEAETLVRAATPTHVFMEDDLDDLRERAGSPSLRPLAADLPSTEDAPLAILFTSGTTGRPKGAILHRAAFRASADASALNLPWREGDRWLLAMPLCHVGGLSVVTRAIHARRGFVMQPRFDAEAALASIARHGVTRMSVVPTMLRRLLEADRHNALAQTRALLVGGAACPPALLEECARRGVLALTTYGLTEACSQVTTQRPRDPRTTERGSGHPLPGTSVRIEDGRIHVRGPTMMSGYLDEPPRADGAWFDTGDLGEIDPAGRLHVHARRVDLIVTGGENVYPAEIEAALESCPGVRRALVFGVSDPEWGEIVACGIEPDPSGAVSEAVLFRAMNGCLATHKRPRRVCFVEALPMTGDKLDRARGSSELAVKIRPWRRG